MPDGIDAELLSAVGKNKKKPRRRWWTARKWRNPGAGNPKPIFPAPMAEADAELEYVTSTRG